jgi:hypothetical protein
MARNKALEGVVTEPAWRSKPSHYLVAQDDEMIPPPAQRMMAKRAGAQVAEAPASVPVVHHARFLLVYGCSLVNDGVAGCIHHPSRLLSLSWRRCGRGAGSRSSCWQLSIRSHLPHFWKVSPYPNGATTCVVELRFPQTICETASPDEL